MTKNLIYVCSICAVFASVQLVHADRAIRAQVASEILSVQGNIDSQQIDELLNRILRQEETRIDAEQKVYSGPPAGGCPLCGGSSCHWECDAEGCPGHGSPSDECAEGHCCKPGCVGHGEPGDHCSVDECTCPGLLDILGTILVGSSVVQPDYGLAPGSFHPRPPGN